MKIVDGQVDYSWKKELETLMIRMANLLPYQPILTNSASLSKYEQKLFDTRQEDYYLFESGLLYIFSHPIYIERMTSVFNNLTYQEKLNFYAYYKSFMQTAINHGFLAEYSLILMALQKYKQTWIEYIKVISIICLGFLTGPLISLSVLIVLLYLRDSNSTLDKMSLGNKQTDLIVQKLNSDLIKSDLDWAKEKLIEYGWLNKSGKIVSSDS